MVEERGVYRFSVAKPEGRNQWEDLVEDGLSMWRVWVKRVGV